MNPILIIFIFSTAVSFTTVMWATRPVTASKTMRKRLVHIQHPAHEATPDAVALEKVEKRDYAARLGRVIQDYEFSEHLQTLLVHAASDASVGSILASSAGVAAACALAVYLVLHQAVFAVLAFLAGAATPYAQLRRKSAARLKAFDDALPDAIDILARGLRAGHSMSSAIELVAEQTPDPLAGEFAQVFHQQKLGIRFRDALLQMSHRVPSNDLHFLITAILVQKETGGDLTEILDRTAHVIRDRVRIQGEVRTHTAQGRLTGWILGLLPVAMLVLINLVSPGYSTVLFRDPTGRKLLYAGTTLIVLGGLVIRKVVDVEA